MSLFKNVKKTVLSSKHMVIRKSSEALYACFLSFVNGRFMAFFHEKPWMDDRKYIEKLYYKRFGKIPDLDHPKTFTEKCNWCKLHDRKEVYTKMVDKYHVKQFIDERCGEGHTAQLFGVWDNPADIDFDSLPEKFVLKPTHSSGVIVCRDKACFDREKAIKELKSALKVNYYLASREWPYKNVPRKVIAEEYLGENLTEYKVFCFNGKPVYTFAYENESACTDHKPQNYFCGAYDKDWHKSALVNLYHPREKTINQPENYATMIDIAEKCSHGTPFLRVDCFCLHGQIIVGELTFSPTGGFMEFNESWDERLGQMEMLPPRCS